MAGGSKFATLGAPLTDLEAAAIERLQDAEMLFTAGRFASAIAMGVYSLEIHLKVRICKKLNLIGLPKAFEIHEIESLLVLSGLRAARDGATPALQLNWEEIVDHSLQVNEMRYLSPANWNHSDALTFFQRLRDPPDGVLPWLLAQP
jgi:hypothetical protein